MTAEEGQFWMFDYRQLARFGISPSILPDGHILVNDPYSFYHRYKRNIWIFIGILMILLILLLFLVITVIMRRRTEMSLRQANLVVESSPAVLFRWRAAPGWPVDLVSKNVIQFGYSVEELVSGRVPFSSMVHPEDLDRVAAEVEHYSATGNDTYNQEYRIVTKSGDVRWVDDRSTIQRHADGSIHHYQGILMDITDRRIAEDNLKRTNGELDRIFNISQDMLCVMDTGGRFIRLNPAWEHALGYPVTEMAGRSFWELIHPYDVEISISSASRLLKGMDVLNHVIRFRHRDGSWRWLESSLTPYSDSLIYAASRDVTERKKTEEALRQSEKRLSEIIDFLPDATFAIDNEGRIITWNRALEEMTGFSSGDMLGKGDHEYSIPFYGIRRPILIDLVFEANDAVASGYNYIKRDGDSIMAEASLNLRGRNTTLWAKIAKLTDSGGKALGAIETLRDITEHKQMLEEQSKLREQLFQSQKMESMGLLAGGIAHDFNNMLTPIIGYSELMMLNLPAVDPNRQRVEQIQRSAELMRHLTSRLLAFSRKQVLDLKVISILEVIRGFEQMIHRTIRENIEIEIIADPEVGMVSADWGQMEQVLLILSLNAQDAMPEGGTLSIEARNMEIGGPYTAAHPDINPGPYVMLSVSDTGCGMDDETKLHIFEPFYTTKEKGKGTGLGLATIYGIVKQHGGGISVYSERDGGSVFRIFLPRVDGEGGYGSGTGHEAGSDTQGDETIVGVEDNDTVRLFACEMLEDLGYRVLSAGAVDAGIKLCGSYSGTIHLLLSDVIMPKMNGRELYEQLKHERPGMKVLFCQAIREA